MLQNYSPFCRSTFVGDDVGKYSLFSPWLLRYFVHVIGRLQENILMMGSEWRFNKYVAELLSILQVHLCWRWCG